jgi:hypothetical protein
MLFSFRNLVLRIGPSRGPMEWKRSPSDSGLAGVQRRSFERVTKLPSSSLGIQLKGAKQAAPLRTPFKRSSRRCRQTIHPLTNGQSRLQDTFLAGFSRVSSPLYFDRERVISFIRLRWNRLAPLVLHPTMPWQTGILSHRLSGSGRLLISKQLVLRWFPGQCVLLVLP